jgi:hypothetical protein
MLLTAWAKEGSKYIKYLLNFQNGTSRRMRLEIEMKQLKNILG